MENFTLEERTVSPQVDCDVAATPIVSSNLPTGPDIVHVQPPGVNRVFRSDVWDHFFPYWIRNKKYEKDMETQKLVEVITWKMRAKCKYCPKHLGDYACDSGPNGTGGPRKHIYKNQCKYYAGNLNLKKQKVLAPGDFNQLTTRAFNQKETLEACVEMIFEVFKKAIGREKLPFKGMVCLDMPTRWNSTFAKLESALRLKRAFKRMEQDTTSSYLAYFNESEEEFDEDGNVIVAKKGNKKVGPPLDKDWDNCEVFVNFLRVFYEVTLRVSASLKPVVHTTLHDIIAIEQVMANMLNVPIESASDTDLLMVEVGLAMKSKYNKYFGEFKNLNPLIILGLVLDPRFKLKHITHILTVVMGWKTYEVEAKTTQIKTLLFSMYEAYEEEVQGKNHLKRKRLDENTNDLVKRQKASYKVGSSTSKNIFVVDWTKYVEQTDESIITHEVDRYLNDPLEGIGKNKNKEEINDEDSGLNDEANWLKGDDITTHFDVEPCIEELEFYEAIETESASGRETYRV
ncbi:unnamed protein product [Cuscuta campestris]|uniref:hAT-like transposase RNase-H fold domain-containing protein n=1 Tax=Cuscuta campestris TaxID=132261 RepID=A0A484KQP3_9ASTE|nr:unnamed protein product [Cuscuta campestris]